MHWRKGGKLLFVPLRCCCSHKYTHSRVYDASMCSCSQEGCGNFTQSIEKEMPNTFLCVFTIHTQWRESLSLSCASGNVIVVWNSKMRRFYDSIQPPTRHLVFYPQGGGVLREILCYSKLKIKPRRGKETDDRRTPPETITMEIISATLFRVIVIIIFSVCVCVSKYTHTHTHTMIAREWESNSSKRVASARGYFVYQIFSSIRNIVMKMTLRSPATRQIVFQILVEFVRHLSQRQLKQS